jgi:hypothetical protein
MYEGTNPTLHGILVCRPIDCTLDLVTHWCGSHARHKIPPDSVQTLLRKILDFYIDWSKK